MIRNLKILIVAAMALAALGALSASGAQAAEEGKFHCSVANCKLTLKADGTTAKEKHHVLLISNGVQSASITCNEITGEATSATKTTKQLTIENIAYDTCSLAGSSGLKVEMNGCDYLFTDTKEIHILCPIGKAIHLTFGTCTIEIPAQTVNSVNYTNNIFKSEVTVTTAVKNIVVHITDEGCRPLGLPKGTFEKGEYSTGNTWVHSTGNSVWYE